MEIKVSTITAYLAICMLILQALAQPMVPDEMDSELSADKRPKYLDTRTLSGFKNTLLIALGELINEGKVSPSILAPPDESQKPKRGRYMGICLRMLSSGQVKPKPCWMGEGRR